MPEVPGARAEQVDFIAPGLHCEAPPHQTDGTAAPYRTLIQGALNSEGDKETQEGKESDGGALYLQKLKHHSQAEGNVSKGTASYVSVSRSERRHAVNLTGTQVRPAAMAALGLVKNLQPSSN